VKAWAAASVVLLEAVVAGVSWARAEAVEAALVARLAVVAVGVY